MLKNFLSLFFISGLLALFSSVAYAAPIRPVLTTTISLFEIQDMLKNAGKQIQIGQWYYQSGEQIV